jgi:membrane protein
LIRRFKEYDINRAAAALTYFSFLSLFPFLLFINSLIGSFNLSAEHITALLAPVLPADVVSLIVTYAGQAQSGGSAGVMSLSLLFTLFSASGAMGALMRALNEAYSIKKKRGVIKSNVLAIFFTVVLGLTLIAVIAAVSLIGQPLEYLAARLRFSGELVRLVRLGVWGAAAAAGFAVLLLTYCVMPNRRVSIRRAMPGTLTTLAGFLALAAGYSIYIDNFTNYTATYGAIGAVLALILLLYMMGILLISGAHFNCVLEAAGERRGKKAERSKKERAR